MANLLDEQSGPINNEGQDINVINKKIKMEIGTGSKVFEIVLWCLLIIPGVIFLIKKISARNYFNKLEQSIQGAASEIDNVIEQRVVILQNTSSLLKKSINLDKEVMLKVSQYRSGQNPDADIERNEINQILDKAYSKINISVENYPDLKSQNTVRDAMQKNDYLQREITAARSNYNDFVTTWNRQIQIWPTNKIVASKMELTTRIPFIASQETKIESKKDFFAN
ncbi:LemA family protein [Williamsoniiplasma somnilux]|uniref:LemA family protein n=1 Tax=Williamsoniiplasma somnilux TaxID=215578 RepID=A0A2K8NZ91_9MOLU|nr:LemA family protein [Williamsoniiplasma somnilux]ATZ19054.1 LemA family protein [Williamsoniiplasma somnilux]